VYHNLPKNGIEKYKQDKILIQEVRKMKKDEKKHVNWEMLDPKPPIIQSGHMENRIQNREL